MNLQRFINEYFHGWTIAEVTTCGTDCGVLKLRRHETFIKVFFHLNGELHWTGAMVKLDHVEACE